MIGMRAVALAKLEKEVAQGEPAPPIGRNGLSLGSVEVEEDVFQPRALGQRERGWQSASHVKGLRDAIRDNEGHRLEPILVWWSGRRWCVVDGHHRLEAYRGFYRDRPGVTPWVPAKALEGNLREAVGASVAGNSRDKLGMSRDDKMDAAWRLTCGGGWTRREISQRAGASMRTLTIMNGVRDKLTGMEVVDLADLSWKRALMISQGRELSDRDEEWAEQQAEEMAEKLRKHLGPNLIKKPDILAMALGMVHPDLPKRLLQHVEWQEDVLERADQLRGDPDLPYGGDDEDAPF